MESNNVTRIRIPDWNSYPSEDVHYSIGSGQVELYHHGHDDASVRRLRIRWKQFALELLPTKGLSILDCSIDAIPIFWEPPLDRIQAPDKVDLAKALLVNGAEVPGTFWIAQFLGGLEMLGLDNWGIQYHDSKNRLHPLHGNVSNIPAKELVVELETDEILKISAKVLVYGDNAVLPQESVPAIWEVTKCILLHTKTGSLVIDDIVTNVSGKDAFPDWGYHVQLRPRPGCRFYLPSRTIRERFGNPIPKDHMVWKLPQDVAIRKERGYIHSHLDAKEGLVQGLLEYPDGSGISIIFPHAPYTMVWNSWGGANSKEFLCPDNPGTALVPKPWDGVGPEIGASDLDHGQAEDPDVVQATLSPGASQFLTITITPLRCSKVKSVKAQILAYTQPDFCDSEISAIASHVWSTAVHEIQRLESYIDHKAFASCVQLLVKHQGRVMVCGVGTSGVAARKLAHSLSCVEIPATFLNPADAVHGALGSVQEGDIVFLISKGGGTKEIIQLIPSLQAKRTTIVGITENADSVLGRSCDLLLQVAIEKEADSFNMLATTSTLVVIALFDALSIAVMQLSGFTKEQFAIIHPSGAVGDRLLQGNSR
ncbi:MAG: DUF4432 family protein [Sphaerochaeta sp.]|nr:DUF4432 family protein [Sphaerochaeta sp.]